MTRTVDYEVTGDNFYGPDWKRAVYAQSWDRELSIVFPFWKIQYDTAEAAGGFDAAEQWAWDSGFKRKQFELMRCGVDRVLAGQCRIDIRRITTDYTNPVDVIANIAQMISPFISMIPGFGTIASVSLSAAAALALGDPIEKAAVDIIANTLPAGPIRETFLSSSYLAVDVYNGERIDRAALRTTRDLVHSLGGSHAVTVFDSGVAIAQGEKVSEETIALARNHIQVTMGFEGVLAFDTGVGIVQNRDAPYILQQLGRDFVYQAAGPQVAALYDAGFSLAQGETLQKAGFQLLIQIAGGNDLAEKALSFGAAMLEAWQNDVDIKDVLVKEVLYNLAPLGFLARSVKLPDAIDELLANADLLSKISVNDVAEYLGIPPEVAWAAQAAIKQLPDGSHVVDPEVMAVLQTPSGGSTTTTLKLASASWRVSSTLSHTSTTAGPSVIQQASAFAKPAAVAPLVSQIEQEAAQGRIDALLAQIALERATRLLERQPWIDYYNRLT
jgi:hypothetical protein